MLREQIRSYTTVTVRMALSEMISRHLKKTTGGESTNREQINVKKLRNMNEIQSYLISRLAERQAQCFHKELSGTEVL